MKHGYMIKVSKDRKILTLETDSIFRENPTHPILFRTPILAKNFYMKNDVYYIDKNLNKIQFLGTGPYIEGPKCGLYYIHNGKRMR